jgi:hypothetical protein
MGKKEKLFKSGVEKKLIPPLPQEKQYLDGLINGLAGKEVEGKLNIGKDGDPEKVIESFMSTVAIGKGRVTLAADHILSSSTIVEKYSYEGEGFSLVIREEDGMAFVRKKSGKQTWGDKIIVADETKILFDPDDENALSKIFSPAVNFEQIEYLGTFKRDKVKAFVNVDGNVHQVVFDTTRVVEDSDNRIPLDTAPFRQIEVEYEGSREESKYMKYRSLFTGKIVGNVELIRDAVTTSVNENGISAEPTTLTKTQWFKELQKKKDQ